MPLLLGWKVSCLIASFNVLPSSSQLSNINGCYEIVLEMMRTMGFQIRDTGPYPVVNPGPQYGPPGNAPGPQYGPPGNAPGPQNGPPANAAGLYFAGGATGAYDGRGTGLNQWDRETCPIAVSWLQFSLCHCDWLTIHLDKLSREVCNWTCSISYLGVLLRFRFINHTMATLRYKLAHNNCIQSDEAAGSVGEPTHFNLSSSLLPCVKHLMVTPCDVWLQGIGENISVAGTWDDHTRLLQWLRKLQFVNFMLQSTCFSLSRCPAPFDKHLVVTPRDMWFAPAWTAVLEFSVHFGDIIVMSRANSYSQSWLHIVAAFLDKCLLLLLLPKGN